MGLTNRVILQLQTILQHFYKLLLYPTSYWFSSRPTDNITFLFIYNHLPHHQFIKGFVKEFVSLTFSLTNICFTNHNK